MPRERVNKSRLGVWAGGCAVIFYTVLVFAYTAEQDRVNNVAVPTRWQGNTVQWSLNPTTGSNVSTSGGTSVQDALAAAFTSWQSAQLPLNGQNQTVNKLTITLGQVSSSLPSTPNANDCLNVVGFTDSTPGDFPTGTIAFTAVSTVTPPPGPPTPFGCPAPSPLAGQNCNLNSCLVDTDIEFNPSQNFSTATPPPSNSFSVQSIATHEIGHFLGLDHSGLINAVMYPFGDAGLVTQSTLSKDDAAGMGFLYPAANFASLTGIISGKVTQGGGGIFAAQVVAVDANTGEVVMNTLTGTDGAYSLIGLPPTSYNILVLPLSSGGIYDITNFSGWSCGYDSDPIACTGTPANPTNYSGTYH